MNQVLSVEQKKLIFQSVREKTGYSLSDCKEALEATKYDAEKAIAILQKNIMKSIFKVALLRRLNKQEPHTGPGSDDPKSPNEPSKCVRHIIRRAAKHRRVLLCKRCVNDASFADRL